jgi:hypothetical protein
MGEAQEVHISGHVSAGVIVEALIVGLFIQCAGSSIATAVDDAAYTTAQIEICGGADD